MNKVTKDQYYLDRLPDDIDYVLDKTRDISGWEKLEAMRSSCNTDERMFCD